MFLYSQSNQIQAKHFEYFVCNRRFIFPPNLYQAWKSVVSSLRRVASIKPLLHIQISPFPEWLGGCCRRRSVGFVFHRRPEISFIWWLKLHPVAALRVHTFNKGTHTALLIFNVICRMGGRSTSQLTATTRHDKSGREWERAWMLFALFFGDGN